MQVGFLRRELLVDPDSHGRQRTAEDTVSFLEQLHRLDIDSAEALTSGSPPPGTRALDAFTAGSLVVMVAGSRVVLRSVLGLVQDWLACRQSGTVSIKIDADELSLKRIHVSDWPPHMLLMRKKSCGGVLWAMQAFPRTRRENP
jgi:hypothetical protein